MDYRSKNHKRLQRSRRVRAVVRGSKERPRLSVFRSLATMRVQLIDDTDGKTILAASLADAKAKNTIDGAQKLGALIAKKCAQQKITTVVFDRAGYKYHGKVKALAQSARKEGLIF